MSLSHRITGPLAVLAVLSLVVVGGLFWRAPAGPPDSGAAARRVVATVGQLAVVRETQRMVSGIVAAGGPHALLHDSVATVLSRVDAMRLLATDQPYQPAVGRLAAELARWRDHVERAFHAPAAGRHSPSEALDALSAQRRLVDQLSGSVAERLEQDQVRQAGSHRAAAMRASAASVAGVFLAALGLAVAALRFSRRLAGDMARLPGELRDLVSGERSGALSAEARKDELGAMAGALRAFAERMRLLTQSQAEMERMALTDPLTGLPNRRGLYDFLSRLGGQGGRAEIGTLAVMHVDLDHFKAINDTYGHEAGDGVLREATRRMSSVIRDADILARLGGDEFVIISRGLTSLGSLERLAERVIREFDAPVAFRDRTLHVTASLGAVLGGRRGEVAHPKRLLTRADIALCHAKSAGRNRWSVFTAAMARDARRRQEQAVEIRHGIARGEFRLWFRPVVDLCSGNVTALDLVLRWHHPDRGLLQNHDFIDAAEAHSLTESMMMPALGEALHQVAAWRAAGATVPVLHIGMSRTMLLTPDIVDRLGWLLDEHRIEPDRIAIQIRERFCTGRGVEAVFANLRRFADLGAAIVIDEFGSIDAALGTITRLGATTIKLDVARIGGLVAPEGVQTVNGANVQALLPGIIAIGESLGITVLAKGVAERAQVESLRAHGFRVMQGDGIAPAIDAAKTRRWLAAGACPGIVSGAGLRTARGTGRRTTAGAVPAPVRLAAG